MSDVVDARGLSCPQPVLLTLDKLSSLPDGKCTVIVDNEVSRENVVRAATNRGWTVESLTQQAGEYEIALAK